ncbi:hypothetical protein [Paraburkholderia sp. J41]|uniref:hypothetical protein n=1 Tax=Paraburkholderia sp. J41 TaxID=2805433 RepID=UPI002AC31477|nr:hypothetical protein [Paraburkholderia sp. J41]
MRNETIFPDVPLPEQLTYEFLGTFARSEYALKCSGFAKGSRKSVEADWDKFGTAIAWHFSRVKAEAFRECVDYLLNQPPRKQVIRDGHIGWQESAPDANLPRSQQTLLMVRRVRNNLFHGAKIWSPERSDDRDRDVRLVSSGLVVIKRCMALRGDVEDAFRFGVF